ncbi:hypothetical protein PsAD2_00602 [Pseudovibrio axinellae]|uniref:Uncharacterized protein n=1 Tax=Pseudovibrio axinellae TaxID=989403 RepID=A0A166AMH0_9HYPH|nr:hypothetical protein [Pseudovibrio axinellae]KZL21311.1 hypothetical protein PsAD2_00602 [Pseudovibrio axinellae]SEQ95697.1 hypothetical protein SAMN05421798_105225 [Pseudovibrio axinellae]
MAQFRKSVSVSSTFAAVFFFSTATLVSAQADQIDVRAASFAQTAQLATFGLYNNAVITDKLNLKRINADYVFMGANPEDPFELVSGSCFGGAVVKNAKIQGGGVCSLKDKTGAPFAISFEVSQIEGRTYSGTWAILGGSEKWATAKGSGTWSRYQLPNKDLSVTDLKGEVTF